MEVTVHTRSEVSREVEIEVKPDELQPHFEKAYREYRPKIEINGFRKGKAPLEMIKKLYGEMIENEYLEKLTSELYREAVKEKDLQPIGEPTLVDLNYKRGEKLWVKIQYDVRPTIELKKYKNLSVEAVVHKIDESEVKDELLRIRRMNSTRDEVQKATDSEHIISADLQELDEGGVPMIGKKTDGARFYLADPQLEQPFKDALQGTSTGSEPTIKFEHQHDEHTHKVNLRATVKKIEKLVLPELNDELVAKVTKDKVHTVDEFRKGIREDLESYWKEKNRRSVINSIASEIIRLHEFLVPESLIRSVLESLLEDVKGQYPKKQLPENFETEKFFQENRAYAIFQSKWALLREEIIKAEQLTVDDSVLVTLAEQEAPKIGIDKERLIAYYKSSDQVKDRLVGDKLIDLLISSSKITELDDKSLPNKLVKG